MSMATIRKMKSKSKVFDQLTQQERGGTSCGDILVIKQELVRWRLPSLWESLNEPSAKGRVN